MKWLHWELKYSNINFWVKDFPRLAWWKTTHSEHFKNQKSVPGKLFWKLIDFTWGKNKISRCKIQTVASTHGLVRYRMDTLLLLVFQIEIKTFILFFFKDESVRIEVVSYVNVERKNMYVAVEVQLKTLLTLCESQPVPTYNSSQAFQSQWRNKHSE